MATSSPDRLASWFDSTLGSRLLADEAVVVGECARRFHGDVMLWAGCHTPLVDTVRGCMVRHRFHLSLPGTPNEGRADVCGARFESDLHEIPVANNTFDAVVLHHALEAVADPRTAIREVARTLAPGGRLLIVSFNPWSLWGVRGVFARVFRDSFSGLHFVSSQRLLDWLTVLGFELQHKVKYVAYGLPLFTADRDVALWRRLRTLAAGRGFPVGGVYVISAVKQVAAARPDWRLDGVRGRKLAPAAYPKLSARIAAHPTLRDRDGIEGPG